MNNSILCLSDLGGFRVFWPLKCLIQDQMYLALDLYLCSHSISSLYTHIHIFDCLNCAPFMFWRDVCVVTQGWTVTCWWWVTYCSTYEHVSNITAGQGRGCRTAQLLNHLRSFSHQHTSIRTQQEQLCVLLLIHTTHRTIISPWCVFRIPHRCIQMQGCGGNKVRGLRLTQQLWKYLGWPRWCKQCDCLQTFSRCA